MATIKLHFIKVRDGFNTNNGEMIRKGMMLECRVRSYQNEKGMEVSDLHIIRVVTAKGVIDNSYAVPDTVYALNCGNFKFLDAVETE